MAHKFFYIFLRQMVYLIQLLINDQLTVLLFATIATKAVIFLTYDNLFFLLYLVN